MGKKKRNRAVSEEHAEEQPAQEEQVEEEKEDEPEVIDAPSSTVNDVEELSAADDGRLEQPSQEDETAYPVTTYHQQAQKPEEGEYHPVPSWIKNANYIPQAYMALEQAGIPDRVLQNLRAMQVTQLFPVQTDLVPKIMESLRCERKEDFCVCAPTGSGKTLAYGIPIVSLLLNRIVRRLRVLVILPTRDLALQVKKVLEQLCDKTTLKIGVSLGQCSFAQEQSELVDSAGRSLIDILVATPGRLTDHIRSTPNFTLEHLRLLVMDEADRLMLQPYQEWLPQVLRSAHRETLAPPVTLPDGTVQVQHNTLRSMGRSHDRDFHPDPPLKKLLFSATLSQNASSIAALHLLNPRYFAFGAQDAKTAKYHLPETLKEHMVVCPLPQKPLALLHLFLTNPALERTICFTSSVESTHRLYLLLSRMLGDRKRIAEVSSDLTPQKRAEILDQFRRKTLHMLICSDVMARGMDLPELSSVVNYDAPVHVKTYVHRVGRTARAGREGHAFTLLRSEEVHHFRLLTKKAGRKPKQLDFALTELDQYSKEYAAALEALKATLEKEKRKGIADAVTTSSKKSANKKPRVDEGAGQKALGQDALLQEVISQARLNFALANTGRKS